MAYSTFLSPTDLTAVEAYLTAKWLGNGGSSNFLPIATPLTIAANAKLDLNGVSQQVASLSDYAPGTAAVSSTVVRPPLPS